MRDTLVSSTVTKILGLDDHKNVTVNSYPLHYNPLHPNTTLLLYLPSGKVADQTRQTKVAPKYLNRPMHMFERRPPDKIKLE